MKKVGILNYHRAVNYGAVLQCLALQNKLQSLGYASEVIDYKNNLIENQYRIRTVNESLKLKYKLLYFLVYKDANSRRRKFEEFRNEHLKLSEEYEQYNINKANERYDKFIVGSDQVWNLNQNNNDFNYLLKFVEDSSKKIAYAASFGVSEIKEYRNEIIEYINDFSSISLREAQGKEILNDLGMKNKDLTEVNEVLDPTFLLDKKTWIDFIGQYKPKYLPSKKYVFVYAFSGSKNIKKAAYTIAKEKDLEIIWLTYGKTLPSKIKYLKDIDPMDFLYYISNAEYVITNSFHGTAFSIIFNKNFSLELLQKGYNVNSRLENILNVFKLHDVELNSTDQIKINTINYDQVNQILEKLTIESTNYLIRALSNNE